MRLVIVESPYAGDIEANVDYARRCIRDALARGEAPIASSSWSQFRNTLDEWISEARRVEN